MLFLNQQEPSLRVYAPGVLVPPVPFSIPFHFFHDILLSVLLELLVFLPFAVVAVCATQHSIH